MGVQKHYRKRKLIGETGLVCNESVEIKEYTLEQLEEGVNESIEILITPEMVDDFAKLSGDFSPIHCNAKFAKKQGFSGRIVHGQLLGAGVSRLVGMRLPGRFGVLQSIDLGFRQPCYAPNKITISGKIKRRSIATGQVTIAVEVTGEDKSLLATGNVKTIVRS